MLPSAWLICLIVALSHNDVVHHDDVVRHDAFVPLVAHAILQLKPKVISTKELQEKILSEFGIEIPQNALRVVLNRAKKKGYVRIENSAYVPI